MSNMSRRMSEAEAWRQIGRVFERTPPAYPGGLVTEIRHLHDRHRISHPVRQRMVERLAFHHGDVPISQQPEWQPFDHGSRALACYLLALECREYSPSLPAGAREEETR